MTRTQIVWKCWKSWVRFRILLKSERKITKNISENIDDECDQHGIAFVKIDDLEVSKRFGIEYDELPTLVYFEEKIPNFYQGDLMVEEDVLEWLIHQKNNDEIEDVSDVVLENLIDSSTYLAVLFCKSKV